MVQSQDGSVQQRRMVAAVKSMMALKCILFMNQNCHLGSLKRYWNRFIESFVLFPMKNQLCGSNYRRLYQIAFWKTFLTYFQIIWICFI